MPTTDNSAIISTKLPTETLDLHDNIVLVAGAGGTIGSGIIGRIRASKIIACDLSEYAIYKLRREYGDRFTYVVGDLSDFTFTNGLFERHGITSVINCAAYKHVDLMESSDNIYSAIKNNIGILLNLVGQMVGGRGSFIHISSDKAVNPVNVMGATKCYAELVVRRIFSLTGNEAVSAKIIRFGNVYGSSGSFIETLDYQIANNLPITVTDTGMRRYFLTQDDAVSLICRAGAMAESGTYILDMGGEVSIMDIVASKNVDNLPVEIIGRRQGEKLQEQLVGNGEQLLATGDGLVNRIAWDSIGVDRIIGNIGLMTEQVRGRMDVERAVDLLWKACNVGK